MDMLVDIEKVIKQDQGLLSLDFPIIMGWVKNENANSMAVPQEAVV